MTQKGKFIVIYGANNLGKTTQTKLIATNLIDRGYEVLKVKYALYNLKPTGPLINDILRNASKLKHRYSEEEFQIIQSQNKKDFQPTIKLLLESNINVIAEDYIGTSYAWGMTRGVSFSKLKNINAHLIKPDISILLDADKRFRGAIEKKHRNEDLDESIWEKNRDIHRELANKFKWKIVRADQKINAVNEAIMKQIDSLLN